MVSVPVAIRVTVVGRSNDKRIRESLSQMTDVNFTDIPLRDALDYLEEIHKIEIWVDTKQLSEEGISSDQSVNLVMSGISLRSVLRLLLEPLLLTYVIEDEVMKVTTQTKADEKFASRVYPVADLVIQIMPPRTGGRGGGMGGGMMGGGMGGGMGMGMFSIPPEKITPKGLGVHVVPPSRR